ncbi:MAG: hypothetical protein GF334_10035 [Candidatus Altiarchaeales archaeon]|nr:hypothetical protein [Candidatus Altiarchaeales archaeon]
MIDFSYPNAFNIGLYFLGGGDVYFQWLEGFSAVDKSNPFPINQSLISYLRRLFTENEFTDPILIAPGVASLINNLFVLIVAGYTFKKIWENNEINPDFGFSSIIVLSLVLNPMCWIHHFVLLVIPYAWLFSEIINNNLKGKGVWITLVSYFLVILTPLYEGPISLMQNLFMFTRFMGVLILLKLLLNPKIKGG